jgi:hypothetical protein
VKERVDDHETVKVLAGLQIFSAKKPAGCRLRSSDDE